jgi:hypothetical protein
VISSIVMADQQSYTLQYNAYGELARLSLPTGCVLRVPLRRSIRLRCNTGSEVIALANNAGYKIYRPLARARRIRRWSKLIRAAASSHMPGSRMTRGVGYRFLM